LAYGSRATTPPPPSASARSAASLDQLLDYLASFQVPHNYFTHFYVLSIACSLFWGWQQWDAALASRPVYIAWLLMLIQGCRRFLESWAYTSQSKSNMWVGHHLLGLIFYLTINVAIWIEEHASSGNIIVFRTQAPLKVPHAFSWRLDVLPAVILGFHGLQHTYHAYLYRLRTENDGYQMPDFPVFPDLICPHYTCETMIYLLLSFLAAPKGSIVNWTLMYATLFVAVNLGVTAVGTRNWYLHKFGKDKMRGKKMMVPWIW
jgi:3-oxo-5-alpha-steroid 4-dehydrogenase 3